MDTCHKCVVDGAPPKVALEKFHFDDETVWFHTVCPNCKNGRTVRVPLIFIEIISAKVADKSLRGGVVDSGIGKAYNRVTAINF